MKIKTLLYAYLLWLLGVGLAAAQTNTIEAFDVSQQGGKTVVRVTTKEPLANVPPCPHRLAGTASFSSGSNTNPPRPASSCSRW